MSCQDLSNLDRNSWCVNEQLYMFETVWQLEKCGVGGWHGIMGTGAMHIWALLCRIVRDSSAWLFIIFGQFLCLSLYQLPGAEPITCNPSGRFIGGGPCDINYFVRESAVGDGEWMVGGADNLCRLHHCVYWHCHDWLPAELTTKSAGWIYFRVQGHVEQNACLNFEWGLIISLGECLYRFLEIK